MSAAMIRGRGNLGYKIINTVTPIAPAPTEVKVTKQPITTPKAMVKKGGLLQLGSAAYCNSSAFEFFASSWGFKAEWGGMAGHSDEGWGSPIKAACAEMPMGALAGDLKALYKSDKAVNKSATPKVCLIKCCVSVESAPTSFKTYKVTKDAGMLPQHKLTTTRQGTRPFLQSEYVPLDLVMAANSKSVPTAKWGLTPMKKIKIGVMRDPPPTPVRPTTVPTKKPAKTK